MLRRLPKQKEDPNLLVGNDTSDDGGVYKLTDDVALVQSLDYFTPIVDDPYMFGQVAAANALSDIYAMGGTPKTVLNIVGYSVSELGSEMLTDILRGASDKVAEAGAITIGGHSIDDSEPKFGLSVTGIVHPDHIYKNVGAKPGDFLVLTKPIGVGIHTTAIKRDQSTPEQIATVTQTMALLNKTAGESLKMFSPHAVTDVTGFGLLGHAKEVAEGSGVTLQLDYDAVPILAGTEDLALADVVPGGSKKNLKWLADSVDFASRLQAHQRLILADAVTSGGLLVSLSPSEARAYVQTLHDKGIDQAAIIGQVVEQEKKWITVK
ncbi:selenide, water dikinase [Pullulanibacillus camelliae]|uniref:Selenide, water dikinase n=1 Tax=Pullulanibacillus camelliae TaxID=1707096 RepID=A0A8J3DZU1_9BACL|nr:selenide, water dikinase [Pullulanibacillus camelliae]